MTKVIVSEDCGNSPKNILVQDLTIAFATDNHKFILEHVTDDVRWNLVGDRWVEGKENLSKELIRSQNARVVELTIQHVATHGKAGAVNGTQKLRSGMAIAFCNFYEFFNTQGTAIKEITSYVIEI